MVVGINAGEDILCIVRRDVIGPIQKSSVGGESRRPKRSKGYKVKGQGKETKATNKVSLDTKPDWLAADDFRARQEGIQGYLQHANETEQAGLRMMGWDITRKKTGTPQPSCPRSFVGPKLVFRFPRLQLVMVSHRPQWGWEELLFPLWDTVEVTGSSTKSVILPDCGDVCCLLLP